MEDKYVVFKIDTYDNDGMPLPGERVSDFFVIRGCDVFAPAGLYAYANNIRTAVELDGSQGVLFTVEQRDYLERLSDDIADLALQWERMEKKVPD